MSLIALSFHKLVYLFAGQFKRPPREVWEQGFRAVTVNDWRWARRDIKTIQLLPNCLGQQEAVDAGVDEVVFVEEGMAIEGSHNNFFMESDNYVLDNAAVIGHIPMRIIHGRYDTICPPISAWELDKALPNARLTLVINDIICVIIIHRRAALIYHPGQT